MGQYHSDQLICRCFDEPHFYWYSVDVLSEHYRERVRELVENKGFLGSSVVFRFRDGNYVEFHKYLESDYHHIKYEEIILHRVEYGHG